MIPKIYDRRKVVSLEIVLPLLNGHESKDAERVEITGTGCKAHVSGLRLTTFKLKGLKCVTCGIEGSFFALERGIREDVPIISPEAISPYHLNLYALKEQNGEMVEVMMTHDHILARGLGGADKLENSQTMCSPCNNEKSFGETALRQKLQASGEMPLTQKQIEERRKKAKLKRNAARKKRKVAMLIKVLSAQAAVVQST